MKISLRKGLAFCGLCALFASIGTAASAQGDFQGDFHHGHMHHARHAIMRAKMAYGRAIAHGDYRAAQRAHMRARAIRHHMRARRHDMYMGHGF